MPLPFETINKGTVAFGFFNIETDLLLLDHLFFFAPEFCSKISELAQYDQGIDYSSYFEVYKIADPSQIGDLMGAIHGRNFQGFIGHVYQIFPFPKEPENFRQKTYGFRNRHIIEPLLKEYASMFSIPIMTDSTNQIISIEKMKFSKEMFQELIRYVWRGGYPKWSNEGQPDYVKTLKEELDTKSEGLKGLFQGLNFD
ncbi:MAG TPA: hypothetical protein VKN82_05425 [Desulfohalobiaceae bacterium]|nr:hypothetical protein [Desulfohalobiaceae bacterium]